MLRVLRAATRLRYLFLGAAGTAGVGAKLVRYNFCLFVILINRDKLLGNWMLSIGFFFFERLISFPYLHFSLFFVFQISKL